MSESDRMLIGLAGRTNAGKSTLIGELDKRLEDLTVLSFDEYDLYPPGVEVPEGIVNWEDPGLFDCDQYLADLKCLRNGMPISLQARSRESADVGITTRTLYPARTTLVEGVFAYHIPETQELFDYRIFLDISTDEMIRRRLARSLNSPHPWDNPEYIRGKMVDGTEQFVDPQKGHAHMILDGMMPTIQLADQVMQAIENLRTTR